MSKASSELAHNIQSRPSVAVPRNGSGRFRALKTQPVTYRTRVYKIHSKALPKGEAVYTVVRDTSEHREETNLPSGKPIFEFEAASLQAVRLKINEFRKSLGRITITDWRNFGSI